MNGASIPAVDNARGFKSSESPVLTAEDERVASWSLLAIDPLLELRMLATRPAASQELHPNAEPLSNQLELRCRALSADASVTAAADAMFLGAVFPDAVDLVLDTPTCSEALRLEGATGASSSLHLTLARAFVATALTLGDESVDGSLPIDGVHRDDLVNRILAALGGADRGIGSAVANIALRLGVMKPIERRRVAITNAASPAAGDVLLYLARGRALREFIRSAVESVTEIDRPVVVVGHSLGGIASFELLATEHVAQVEALITVGSQVSFLYELNALPVLEYPTPLPATVPPWVNVFDPRDLLSYSAADVFNDRVSDARIDNKQPFPRCHSAYFSNERFYDLLAEVIPR